MSIGDLAAACQSGHSCMRPCRTESGDEGERTDTAIEYAYDPAGRLVSWSVALGALGVRSVFTATYDDAGRPLGSGADDDVLWHAHYDDRGLLERIDESSPEGSTTIEYPRDRAGRLTGKVVRDAEGTTTYEARFEYDEGGRVVSVFENRPGNGTIQHRMSYGASGRLSTIEGAHTTAILTYSPEGRLVQERMVGDEQSDATFQYDGRGRLVEEDVAEEAGGKRITKHFYDCP